MRNLKWIVPTVTALALLPFMAALMRLLVDFIHWAEVL